MKFLGIFSRSINSRLFLLTLLPLCLMTILLAWHTIESRRAEDQSLLDDMGTHVSAHLATISSFAFYTGREDLLQSIAQTSADVPYLSGIAFLDHDRRPIVSENFPQNTTPGAHSDGPRFTFVERPVFLTGSAHTGMDVPLSGTDGQKPQGWVVIALDKSQIQARSREIFHNHLLISALVLLAATLLTWYLSGTLVFPIKRLTATVRELEKGNLDARVQPTTRDELAALAHGINHLARSVAEGRGDLEEKVQRATVQLQQTLEDLRRKNRELETARQEAEAGNRAKGDFLAQMSHELRTPITAIQGFVNLLANSRLSPAEKRYCRIIHQASLQLLQLVDDILDTTRFQSHGITIELAPFNLAECVETPLSLMAPAAHEKKVELLLDIAPDVPFGLEGDSLRIRQVIYNLVANAIKFTRTGSILVHLSCILESDDRMSLGITVTDTGIGIPEKHRQQIFDAFSQADTSISRRFGGSGLGLSIVKNLVSLMGGDIDIESESGRGTTFQVNLPLKITPLQPAWPESAYRRALLYDTHPLSRKATEHMLARFIDQVESCERLPETDVLRDRAPDIVIYTVSVVERPEDIRLALQYLRKTFTAPIILILPMEGFGPTGNKGHYGDFPPLSLIHKPPVIAELAEVLKGQGPAKPQPVPEVGHPSLSGRVLVAEDNEFMRLLLFTLLERAGCDYSAVMDGLEAVKLCRYQRFDIILMDVHMPVISGLAAIKAIRRDSRNTDTPIVMLTADILQQEETALFEAGADELMFKPFDEDKLLALLTRLLRKPQGSDIADQALVFNQVPRDAFVLEVEKLTGAVREAFEAGDPEGMREAIHLLLGIAGVFKMTYLERAVRRLHTAVKKTDHEVIAAALDTLDKEVAQLRGGN